MLKKGLYRNIIFLFLLIFSCKDSDKELVLDASNPNLVLENGVLFFGDAPFHGLLVQVGNNNGLKKTVQYRNGRKHGYEKHWYSNDSIAVHRMYDKGVKIGIHYGWWEDGSSKFRYHFNPKGEYHGRVLEWYPSGRPYKVFNYENGQEVGNQRLWKRDGAIKANYEVVGGERFGLIGLKKCFTVIDANEIQ